MPPTKQQNYNLSGNVCSRCGKTRTLYKTWEETVVIAHKTSTILHEQYVCPDVECQRIVETDLAEKKKISDDRAAATQQRIDERNAARARKTK